MSMAIGPRTQSFGGSTAAKADVRELTFRPTVKQEKFMKDTAGQLLLSGSFGAGKSKIGTEKGYMLNMRYPGNRGLIVRKAFGDVRASTVNQTLLESVIPDTHIPEEGHNKGEHIIEHFTGVTDPTGEPVMSEIHYHGLDSGRKTGADDLPRKIGSMEYGWIFVDEGTELRLGEWNQLLGRLRYSGKEQGGVYYTVPIQQIFTATNPAGPNHWMYDKFFREGGEADTSVYRMNVRDNPGVSEAYVQRMETNFSGIYYDRYVEGKWVGAEGMIFSEYDPAVHLVHPDDLPGDGWTLRREHQWGETGETSYWVDPPAGWSIYRSIDFGYTNPFVCQWWARGPDDTLVLFRELYRTETIVEDLAETIKEMDPSDRSVTRTFADHDAEDRDTLNRHGITTEPARKDVSPGLQAVKSRMKLDDRGRANLYIMEGARTHKPDPNQKLESGTLKTIDEIPGYVWDRGVGDGEEPLKEDDHGCDGMRYVVYSIDGGINLSAAELDEWTEVAQGF